MSDKTIRMIIMLTGDNQLEVDSDCEEWTNEKEMGLRKLAENIHQLNYLELQVDGNRRYIPGREIKMITIMVED